MSYPNGKPTDSESQQSYGRAPQQQGAYVYEHRQPAAYPQASGYPQVMTVTGTLPPNSYLAWSIVSMLLFCLPLGIAALVFSLGVSADYAAGLHTEAHRKSSVARVLNIVATVLGIVVWIIVGVAVGLSVNAYYVVVG